MIYKVFCPQISCAKKKKENEWHLLAIITQFNSNLHIFYKREKAPRCFFEIGAFWIKDSGRVRAFSREELFRVNTLSSIIHTWLIQGGSLKASVAVAVQAPSLQLKNSIAQPGRSFV